jgi:vacuolar-type H+-ATPase subunit H
MIAKSLPTTFSETELSPLDQIRYTEAEITRQIAAARETAEKMLAQERAQAARLKREAQEAGQKEGENRFKDMITETEGETRVLVMQAHQRAEELRQRGQQKMAKAIRHAVHIILGDTEQTNGLQGEGKGV